MLLLVLLVACARPLAPGEWRESVPDAPCEARTVETDGMGSAAGLQRFDAAGRLIFGTTRLTYDGRGREYLTWDGPRLVRADSYYDQNFRRGICDACEEPATRTVARMTLDYDGDRLVHTDRIDREFHRDRRGGYVLRDRRHYTDDIAYDGDRLVRFHGTIRWDNHHPLSREGRLNTETLEWSGDRLVVYRWPPFVQRFTYDERGRLVSDALTSPDQNETSTWRYDAAGRLTARVWRGREWTWTYDDAGRLIRLDRGDGMSTVYSYTGTCAANLNAPALPTALGRARLVPCAQTPGALYDSCD
jgi:YD repeat-containing protein